MMGGYVWMPGQGIYQVGTAGSTLIQDDKVCLFFCHSKASPMIAFTKDFLSRNL